MLKYADGCDDNDDDDDDGGGGSSSSANETANDPNVRLVFGYYCNCVK